MFNFYTMNSWLVAFALVLVVLPGFTWLFTDPTKENEHLVEVSHAALPGKRCDRARGGTRFQGELACWQDTRSLARSPAHSLGSGHSPRRPLPWPPLAPCCRLAQKAEDANVPPPTPAQEARVRSLGLQFITLSFFTVFSSECSSACPCISYK